MTQTNPKTSIWKSIQGSLTADIASGRYRPGDKLPTEAELSKRFGVNRHTVRRALSEMADAGLLHARRGAGVFVTQKPADYPIGKRVRFHQNLHAAGRLAGRQITSQHTRPATATEAEALGLEIGEDVHEQMGVSTADNQPLALFRGIVPADRFPEWHDLIARHPSVTAAFRHYGIEDYTRLSTRIDAKLATSVQAVQLQIQPGAPILRTISISIDAKGVPIEYGHTWFAGDKVTLTLAEGG